jgi:aspartyl protease family protein
VADFPRWLKPITLWLVAGTLLYLAVQAWLFQGQRARFQVSQGIVEIQRSHDGHFHWPGKVNGREVDFLVDTGATRTALPAALAQGLPAQGAVRSETAGGVVSGQWVRVDLELEGGVSAQQLPVAVLPDLRTPLLGMDVLSRLKFSQSGGVLRLERP